ncbi:MAG: protein kinase [Ahniella sp.]|nr:protein kinase [Ahniella sp.]
MIEAALDLPTDAEREQLLAECADPALAAEACRLLGLRDRVDVLDRLVAPDLLLPILAPQLPERIGPYRIKGLLGSGGMGAVYLGVRDDGSFSKEAAIKVIRDVYSLEQRERFQRERELLARLDHPAIARVMDGGSTDQGHPWMAIERVLGRPLDQYARDEHQSVPDRIRLLQRVIDAVQFAHQNLIVHRSQAGEHPCAIGWLSQAAGFWRRQADWKRRVYPDIRAGPHDLRLCRARADSR